MGEIAVDIFFVAFLWSVPLLLIWAFLFRLPGLLAEVLTRRLMRDRPDAEFFTARARWATYCAATLFLAYSVYDAIYPADAFFLGEFQEVTLRSPSPSARVIDKTASYPDFHGDYCSFSRIWLGAEAYQALLADLEADERFKRENGVGSREENEVHSRLEPLRVVETLTRPEAKHPDRDLSIRFLEDGAQVEVSLCVT